ncbi:unnamed protein product [Adineta ricciae]|uniref:Jacalin-type lectin domain-containing protein n=1 Tax=Adineta ricciae TaxID=249248 RepID=A0A813PE06_ADIRI|nr:unnamed protein product [Adineta ricciae]CAF1306258.1 unnamed protein product [Adineta ricciae]
MLFIGKLILVAFPFIIAETSGSFYNQLRFASNASWNANGITVANSTLIGLHPFDIFIDKNNTIYVPKQDSKQIILLFKGNLTSTRNVSANLSNSLTIFVKTSDDIYVDTYYSIGGISRITSNSAIPISRMNLCYQCSDIFISQNDLLYCSFTENHQVLASSLITSLDPLLIVAGTGSVGSTSTTLRNPLGIFVDDTNDDLYVADCRNNRIQLFKSKRLTATTVAGSGSINVTIDLNYPSGIALDSSSYLFIVDTGNNRIIAEGLNGFRCIVGCTNSSGSASNQLNNPWSLSFDSYGNLFISDQANNRIQKFNFVSSCYDGIKNQDETDIDCGGSNCSKCPLTNTCLLNSDCYINECDTTSYTCQATSGIARGGQGGSIFSDLDVVGLYGRTFPISIILRCGSYIDAIQVTYETSNQTQGSVITQAPRRGGTNTGPHQFDLLPGERIVKVNGRSGTYVNGLQFTTSTGNVSAYCGGSGGTAFTEQYSGYVLSYISGRCGSWLNQIQFHWIPA